MSDQIPEIVAIGADFSEMERRMKVAKAMVSLLKDAGEDSSEMEAELRRLTIKKDKWANALRTRGIDVTSD